AAVLYGLVVEQEQTEGVLQEQAQHRRVLLLPDERAEHARELVPAHAPVPRVLVLRAEAVVGIFWVRVAHVAAEALLERLDVRELVPGQVDVGAHPASAVAALDPPSGLYLASDAVLVSVKRHATSPC